MITESYQVFYLHCFQLSIKKSENIKFLFLDSGVCKNLSRVAVFKLGKKLFTQDRRLKVDCLFLKVKRRLRKKLFAFIFM